MTDIRKRLAGNFISLSMVQGLSILFPLIIFPYLVRVLGVKGFGIFTLIQTFIMYFDLLISFGFGLTATQQIAKYQGDRNHINQIISTVYAIKVLLFVMSMILFFITAFFIPYVQENTHLIFVAAVYLLGNLLMPDWYFQGIQKMRTITIVALISRLAALLLILLLVKTKEDVIPAILAMGAGNLIGGLSGFIFMQNVQSYKWITPRWVYIKEQFKDSGYVFSSIILAPLYSSVNLFILQFFTNPLIVGYYAVAEKVFTATSMLTSVANRTFYPHLSQLWENAVASYRKSVKKIAYGFLIAFSAIALFQYVGAEFILWIIGGEKNISETRESAVLLRILSIGLIYSPFVSFFFQLMVLQRQRKETVINIVIAVLVNLVTASFAARFYGAIGMAVNLCVIMLLIACLNYRGFRKGLLARERVNL